MLTSDQLMYFAGGLLLIVAAYLYFQRRTAPGSKTNLNDPNSVLEEVEIYLSYGRKRDAKDLLNRAIQVNPSNPQLKAKLSELDAGAT